MVGSISWVHEEDNHFRGVKEKVWFLKFRGSLRENIEIGEWGLYGGNVESERVSSEW